MFLLWSRLLSTRKLLSSRPLPVPPSRLTRSLPGPFSFFLSVLSQISRKVIPFYASYDPRWTTIRLQIIKYFDCQANKSRERESLKVCLRVVYPDLRILKFSQSVFACDMRIDKRTYWNRNVIKSCYKFNHNVNRKRIKLLYIQRKM